MKFKKKSLIIIAIVAAVAIIATFLLMPEAVTVSACDKRDVSLSIKVTGNIAADEVETIYAPVSGKIEMVNVKAGDAVTTETVIASYDLTLIKNDYEKANSAFEAAKNNFEAAKADSEKASARYAEAAANFSDNNSSMEELLAEINAMEISNRAGYLSLEDRKEIQALELENKDIENKINIRMAELNGAQNRMENLKDYSNQYVAARAEVRKTTRELSAARAGIKAGQEGSAYFTYIVSPGDKVEEDEIVAKYNIKDAEVSVRSPLSATVKEVRVATGEPVSIRTSQTIITFETQEFQDRKASAQANLESAKANVSFTTGETISAANIEAYNASIDIREFYGQIQDNLERINELNAKAYEGEMDTEEYTKYKELQSALTLVQQRFSASLSERQFQEGRMLNEYALLMHSFNADVAEAGVIEAEYNLDLAKEGILPAKEGVITERLVNDGGTVTAGEPICKIQYTGIYKVNVMVSKYDIDDIELNQKAVVTLGDIKYDGEVSKIFPVAETDSSGKPKVKVEVLIEDPEIIPTIGLEANVEILAGAESEVLSVPTEGIYGDEGGDYVYVLSGFSPEKKYVTIGLKGADYTVIKEGLSEGEKVITSPFSEDMLGKSYRGTK